MKHLFVLVCAGLLPLLALAHPGHGMPEPSHWHASDVLGFAAVVGGVGALLWWRNRK